MDLKAKRKRTTKTNKIVEKKISKIEEYNEF